VSLTISVDEIVARSRDGRLADGSDWGRVRLREVAQVQNGFAFKSALFNKGDRGLPLLRIRDVGDSSTEVYYDGDYEERYIVTTGDLVVGMDGDFRVSPWAGPTALLNQRVARIRLMDDARYDARFLLYALPGYLDAINQATSSVTVKHLSSRTLEDIPLPNPPLDEQQRIVAALEEQLSRLDAGDASVASGLHRIHDLEESALNSLVSPKWPLYTIDEVASGERYSLAIGPFGSNLKVSDYTEDGVPLVFVRHIRAKDFHGLKPKFVSREKAASLAPHSVRRGDVLITKMGDPPGDVAVYTRDDTAIMTADCIKIDPRSDILPEYLGLALSSPKAQRMMLEVTSGVAQKKMSLARFRQHVSVPVPDHGTQRAVVERAAEIESISTSVKFQLEQTQLRSRSLRRLLLREAFAGRLAQDASVAASEGS
jgi:type I restriction enzyme S subunit